MLKKIRRQNRAGGCLGTINVLIVVLLSALLAFGQAKDTVPLYKAIRDGKAVAKFRGKGGSSGDSVEVQVSKTPKAGPGPFKVTVPPGSMLHSSNGAAQSMVIMGVRGEDVGGGMFRPSSRIVVPGAAPVTYILSAFCAEFEKENPSTSDTFTLEDQDPMLACVGRHDQLLSVPAEQAAVWMYTDHESFDQVNLKFRVTPAEWSEGEKVYQRCQASIQGLNTTVHVTPEPLSRTHVANVPPISANEPNDAKSYFRSGVALYQKGQVDSAADAFRKATAIDPSYSEAYVWLGRTLMGKATVSPSGGIMPYPGTIEALQTYLKLEPNGKHAVETEAYLDALGVSIANPSRSGPSTQNKLEVERQVKGWVAIADIDFRDGVYAEAIALYEKALRADPEYPGVKAKLDHARKAKATLDSVAHW